MKVVGVTGFEPATSASRTLRATKLRYTPKVSLTGVIIAKNFFHYHTKAADCRPLHRKFHQ
jgi:hypothetical protein